MENQCEVSCIDNTELHSSFPMSSQKDSKDTSFLLCPKNSWPIYLAKRVDLPKTSGLQFSHLVAHILQAPIKQFLVGLHRNVP